MEKKSLSDLDKEVKQYGGSTGSDMFEFKRGKNEVRILNFPTILATHFIGGKGGTAAICYGIDEGCPYHKGGEDKPGLKMIAYVLDRADGLIKLAELPLSIRYSLTDLQNTKGFEFADFPMPYDVQIVWDPDNSDPKAKYRATGIPVFNPLTPEELDGFNQLMGRMTPEQYVEKRKAKAKGVSTNSTEDTRQAPAAAANNTGIDYPEEEINPDDIPF